MGELVKLKPFQEEGVQQIYRFGGRALLADDQGLGKTIQALAWLKRISKCRPAIVVTPASMKYTWQMEAARFGIRAEVLDGVRPHPLMGGVFVLNYSILNAWLDSILELDPQVVILDEIQALKNPEALRTKSSKKLVEGARSVVGLSGTPLLNRPIELWSILGLIRPKLFPSQKKYAWKYCKPRYTRWGWKFDGATRTGQLGRILRRACMIRRVKKDVLSELPEKSRQIVVGKLTRYREYQQAESDFLVWLRKTHGSRVTKAKKSQALVKVGYLLRLVAELKISWVKQWIKDFFEIHVGKKLVALTSHRLVIDELKKAFPSVVVLDGRIVGRKRDQAVMAFQKNRKINLFVGNTKAAGVGITLTAAHHLVFLDFPWTPGDLLQGEDRVHRIGQEHQVLIYYLVALDTIEEKLIKILRSKARVLREILDGEDTNTSLEIFQDLLKGKLWREKKSR